MFTTLKSNTVSYLDLQEDIELSPDTRDLVCRLGADVHLRQCLVVAQDNVVQILESLEMLFGEEIAESHGQKTISHRIPDLAVRQTIERLWKTELRELEQVSDRLLIVGPDPQVIHAFLSGC